MFLLPIFSAAIVVILTARLLALRILGEACSPVERAVATSLFALVLPIAIVRLLGALGLLQTAPLVVTTALVALFGMRLAGPKARSMLFPGRAVWRTFWARLTGHPPLLAIAMTGLFGLALAVTAAALLPIWAWDALSYHLPIVQDALATAKIREVPTHVAYVNGYPKNAELLFIYVRLLLPDDGLLDLAQLPFALAAVVTISALARRAGASGVRAISYGVAFLAIPLVSMQLATNYVDIAYAAALLLALFFVTGKVSRSRLVCAGLSIGLLLGIKPTAPPAVLLLGLVVLIRSAREKGARWGLVSLTLAALVGGETYLRNLILHRNPIWPVSLAIGPLILEGPDAAGPMFTLGLPPPYDGHGWLRRLVVSLFVEPLPPIFDMRLGGFGPAFALLAIAAGFTLVRSQSLRGLVLLSAIVSFATPAAHWLRYSLAFPGVLLAVSATARFREPFMRKAFDLTLAALLAIGLARALPGFTGEGPSLVQVAMMPKELRERAMIADGPEGPWVDAKALLAPGEAFAYDDSLALPGRLARADGTSRVVYVPRDLAMTKAAAWAEAEGVRFLALREGSPIADAVGASPRFRCAYGQCVVYERDPLGSPIRAER